MQGTIQAFIKTRGGLPTEKEIEDYQERKLEEERKKWDSDFGYSEPGTGTDRLLEKIGKWWSGHRHHPASNLRALRPLISAIFQSNFGRELFYDARIQTSDGEDLI